jgi:hypothetical protein
VKFDVQGEELFLLVALPGGPQPGRKGHELAAVLQRNPLRREPRGLRLDGSSEFVQCAQLVKPAGGCQAPPDHLRVVKVPALLLLDHGAEPAPGLQHAHGAEHLRRFPNHRPRNLVLGFQLVDPEDGVRRQRAIGNGQAQPFQKRPGHIFRVLRLWSLHK